MDDFSAQHQAIIDIPVGSAICAPSKRGWWDFTCSRLCGKSANYLFQWHCKLVRYVEHIIWKIDRMHLQLVMVCYKYKCIRLFCDFLYVNPLGYMTSIINNKDSRLKTICNIYICIYIFISQKEWLMCLFVYIFWYGCSILLDWLIWYNRKKL